MAHEYRAEVIWTRDGAVFTDNRYSRGHVWRFDGGVEVPASSSPLSVKLPLSRADAVDPEEALVVSLSSCHMLFFLDYAKQAKFLVESYEDQAEGLMEKGADGRVRMTRVTLRPLIRFGGERRPSEAEVEAIHHKAHDACYIANSVTSEIVVEGRGG